MKKFKTELLVRDKMVNRMETGGIKVHHKILNDEEYIQCLRNKIIEEATELATENDRESIVEEIADVKEVLEYLQKTLSITDTEVLQAQDAKRQKHGAFNDRLYTKYLEIDENNSAIDYYLKRPEKYPEIK